MSTSPGARIGIWLSSQLNWRNALRTFGMVGMGYEIFTKAHPDPTVLLALGAMMGLPTFLGLEQLTKAQGSEESPKRSSEPKDGS